MNQEEQQCAFVYAVRTLIERFAQEYDLTYQSMYGCLLEAIVDLKLEHKYSTPMDYSDEGEYEAYENDEEEYEEDDGDGWKKDSGEED